ncbi:hypothetical protein [Flavobacterium quisquiliarum]|uniref:Uncharacterized protein n=1 Tax=Flavobacterium quisquiliarum TaxID=1834436 RepID=A0ABV8WAN5_9FLAO|nr:hypothetical protein [Flavobacterium quisquiliarum]MBW1658142.1 hypothetical protein [Flavobacterium quisquiliarum]NWK99913.1 hypothetical protein [Flavobacterium collinsii]
MKKKLEADLISIAHRILKLKNKSDINQLYLETQKLYEKLAVLKFVEENFDAAKPTIGQADITNELETLFNKEEEIVPTVIELEAEIKEETPVVEETILLEENDSPEIIEEETAEVIETPEPVIEETPEPIAAEIIEPEPEAKKEIEKVEESKNTVEELSFTTVSDLKPIPDFKPAFELDTQEIKEDVKEEIKENSKTDNSAKPTILFEDFGINYADAQFVKVDSFEAVPPTSTPSINDFKEPKKAETAILETTSQPKAVSLNEKLSRGFHIDLNDRIAFTKNLFGNSTEDYSRVLNQLMTFDSYSEAKEFIENMVKPDYNNWDGKEDYAERFMGIIEKKFA